ncbi:response regulator, partial [Endomicrobium sp. AH-315-J14]|nr:response regulator [Endomicrobium sp. AH-315-J14]
ETAREDGSVTLSVSDNGRGVPNEDRDRIFEPFMTTKLSGQGVGLGLSMCAEIARRHGGRVELESEPGRGSRFKTLFPLQVEELSSLHADRSSAPPASERNGESGLRALVIDDEGSLLKAYARVLRRVCAVVTARGGAEAVALLSDDQDFDVILCDVMMPDVDGEAVCEFLTEAHPDLSERLVLMTGGAVTVAARRFVEQTPLQVLEKPVSSTQLRDLVTAYGRVGGS